MIVLVSLSSLNILTPNPPSVRSSSLLCKRIVVAQKRKKRFEEIYANREKLLCLFKVVVGVNVELEKQKPMRAHMYIHRVRHV